MKTFIKRNKLNIFLVTCCLLMFVFILNTHLISEEEILNNNFVSINSIFAGFLFTSLGIVVGILDKEIIIYLDKHGYLDSYINGIVIGLFMHIVSAVMELIVNNIDISFGQDMKILTHKIIFMFLITGIVFFIKSMFNIIKLIKIIRRQNKRHG